MRLISLAAALLLCGAGIRIATADTLANLPVFQFEQQAQQHCPDDSVVWAVAHLGIYNSSRERWYGKTSDGTFVCLQDAEKAGYRATSVAR